MSSVMLFEVNTVVQFASVVTDFDENKITFSKRYQ